MTTSKFSAEDQVKILKLFENMNDSPGKDSDKLAKDWLKSHNNRFSGFINNEFLPKIEDADVIQLTNFSESFATATVATEETIQKANESSKTGLRAWKSNKQRSLYLHKIADSLEKNAELFSQVESLSSGKHLYRTRNKDVPNLIQSFRYYSSLARDSEYLDKINKFSRVVCVIAGEFNNPILSVSWRVASVLATGSVVSLLVEAKSCPSAFLLAELCSLSGLPAGVLNVLPIDQSNIKTFPSANRIIFTGEFERSQKYIEMAVESYAKSSPESEKKFSPCEILVSKRPVVIVYESADLHSASNGVLETLCFGDTRTMKGGCNVYVQASIKDTFHALLEQKIAKIKVGKNFSKTHMSCIVTREQHDNLKLYFEEAQKRQFKIVQGVDIKDETYIHWNPTLICDVPVTSKLFDMIEGPIVVTTLFRTVKESISLFNHRKLGSDVSIWSEKLPLALEVAQNLWTRNIWINAQNLFDASVPYGGLTRSGNSIEGGKEALLAHLDEFPFLVENPAKDTETYGTENSSEIVLKNNPNIKLNNELHIGGSYKKPSGGSYRVIKDSKNQPYAYMGEGSSDDIQAAVSCAAAAQQKWQNLGKYKRLKVLEKAFDSYKAKKNEFLSLLKELINETVEDNIDDSISIFHFWANLSNYCDGSFIETEAYGKVLQERMPVGVIGIQIGEYEDPLLYFVSTVIPAIAYGNAVVVVASGKYTIPFLKLCEILQVSGVPGGTVNIVTGTISNLTRHLAVNMLIDAIWYCDDGDLLIQNSCITRPKKVFRSAITCLQMEKVYEMKLISEATYLKNIFVPAGDIFAN